MAKPVTIIGSFASPYVRKLLACLNLKGVAYEVDPITPFFGNDEFEAMSPLRRIPVLVDGDFHISDSSVIAEYVDETYPGHPLLPADPRDRARARWFDEFADVHLGDLLIWSLFYQRIVRPMVWNEPTDEARVADAIERRIPAALDFLEGELPGDGYLFGDIGLADIAIASFFQNGIYAGYTIDAKRWPRSASFMTRVLAHPAVATLLAFEAVQIGASIKGRRQALRDAGAPLSERTWGTREARRSLRDL